MRPGEIELRSQGLRLFPPITALDFAWRDLLEVRAEDPWPCFEIVTRAHEVFRIAPRFDRDADAIASEVMAMFAHVATMIPHAIAWGWVRAKDVEWEAVAAFPGEGSPASGAEGGPYRHTPGDAADPVMARRPAPRPLDRLLASRFIGRRPNRSHAIGAAMVSAHWLYARLDGPAVYRVPLSELRSRRATDVGDAIYTFGRRLHVWALGTAPCPVRAHLDQLLHEAGANRPAPP